MSIIKRFSIYLIKNQTIIKQRSADELKRIEAKDGSVIIHADDYCLYCPKDYNYIIFGEK